MNDPDSLFDVPNLDALTVRGQPAGAEGYAEAARVLRELSRYASARADAMGSRARGDVGPALRSEAKADRVYRSLPAWARW